LPRMAKSMMGGGSTKGVINGADKIQKAVTKAPPSNVFDPLAKKIELGVKGEIPIPKSGPGPKIVNSKRLDKLKKQLSDRKIDKATKRAETKRDKKIEETTKDLKAKNKVSAEKYADLEAAGFTRPHPVLPSKSVGHKVPGPKLEFGAGSGAALGDLQRNTAKTHATKMQTDERYRKAFNAAMKKEAEK